MTVNTIESLQNIRRNTDEDEFVTCEVHGASVVFRPVNTTRSVLSDLHVENSENKTNKEITNELIQEYHDELLWKPYYDIAVETPSQKEILISTIVTPERNEFVNICRNININRLRDFGVRHFDNGNNSIELKINGKIMNEKAIAKTKEEYPFEYNDIRQRAVNTELLKKGAIRKGAFETTIDDISVENDQINLSVSLIDNTKWKFDVPISWSEENNFVKLVNEIGVRDVSEIKGEKVYIRFGCENRETVSLDITENIQLIHDWNELIPNNV